jgi:hypothetical protein
MSEQSKPNLIRVLRDIQNDEATQRQSIKQQTLDPQLRLLREWQVERLKGTYADLLESEQYRPACQFFLSDIYAPRDFSQRDHDVEQLYRALSRVLPDHMLRLLENTLALNHLSNQLDRKFIHVLSEQLGVIDSLTTEQYLHGYRLCDNYDDRAHQIDLVTKILQETCLGSQRMLVGITIKLAQAPARYAGWDELYNFLARGYAACKRMRQPSHFVDTIDRRERLILNKIYSQEPDPFNIEKN